MITKDAVWLITGCSKGLGCALAREALAAGYRVIVTARRIEDVADLVAGHGDAALPVALDVTDGAQVAAAVAAAEQRFGAVDVLVNNAGYGYLAAIEAGTQAGHGKQQGDPARGARAIIAALEAERPPVHLLIGGDALDQFRAKLDDLRRETDAWEEVTRGTDFEATASA